MPMGNVEKYIWNDKLRKNVEIKMCIRELLLQKNEDKRKCCRMSTEVEKQFRKMLPQNLERVKEAKKNAKGLLMKFKKKRFWKGVEKAKQEASSRMNREPVWYRG